MTKLCVLLSNPLESDVNRALDEYVLLLYFGI